ncbi:MAG TPA: four helix bundle protein [Chitinophagaceae bacterium]|nr:four helix bundle protein [Chitinophagaceae bacterium]
MAKIERFEDLDLWKDAVKMGVSIYKVTEEGKMAKDFSARDQLRRAAISVSNNIAEGFEYNNNKAFVRFLMYAKGSAGELRSQLFVLREAGILEESKFHTLWENALKLSKSIEGFRKYLREFDRRKTNP